MSTGNLSAGDLSVSAGDLSDLIADIAAKHTEPSPGELPACWPVLVELGLPLVGVDEAYGGSGGSLADLAVLVRALGRHAISTPLIESAVANWVVATARGELSPGLRTISAEGPGRAEGPGGAEGPGRAGGLEAVGWARHAEQLVLYRGDLALLTDLRGPGITVEPGTNVAGEPRDDIRLDAVDLATLDSAPPGQAVAARLGLLRAAALTGAVEGAYELTRGYVSTREQFGAPLVRIPAVASNLAIMKAAAIQCDAALARAVAWAGAEAGTQGAAEAGLAAVASARIIAGRAATQAARIGHQLHGAIGVTAEYSLHHFTKRLWAWRDADTSEHDWSVLLGNLAAVGGETVFWEDLTAL